jgi:hypothetical protein
MGTENGSTDREKVMPMEAQMRSHLLHAALVAAVVASVPASAATLTEGTLTANFSFAPNYTGAIETFNELSAGSVNGAGYNPSAVSGPLSVFGGAGTLSLSRAQIVNGSASGEYAAPNPFKPDPTNYVSVYNGGTATFSLAQGVRDFGLVWGSVDASNSLTFYGVGGVGGGDVLGTVYGSTVAASLPGVNTTGGPGPGSNWNPGGTVFADIVSSSPIYAVVAGSGQNSFEFDHVGLSDVPVPSALMLFGTALAGLVGIGWRAGRGTRIG